MEQIVDATVARRQLGTLLDKVFHKGDIFTIERKGKALAKIVPIENIAPSEKQKRVSPQQEALLKELNGLPNIGIDDDPTEVLRAMREQKKITARHQYGK
ncbi:MAG: hypothetical protein R3F02_02670 [Thiolinea sp.]